MGSVSSVGKFNSKYMCAKVRIFQAIIKSTDCWPDVKGTGIIPDFHMLCCIMIIIFCRIAKENLAYVHVHVENGNVCPPGHLRRKFSWAVAFISILGTLLMIRPKQNIYLFKLSCQIKIGSVGQKIFLILFLFFSPCGTFWFSIGAVGHQIHSFLCKHLPNSYVNTLYTKIP